jgi:hypothetical protein
MTHVIHARNVNDALIKGLDHLMGAGNFNNSRNGRVLVAPGPVITEYSHPNQRVLFSPLRDANPFFHFMESMWMLAGRDDVKFPASYAANIASFSDNGIALHGAYGTRWRVRMGFDQLDTIIAELRSNPESRRCVLQMWDANKRWSNDLEVACTGGKDVPCNTQAYFDTLNGVLNMTVTCRSNDAVWGCYGANAVHFSMLHEYIASMSGLPQGVYRQFSNNFHIYYDRPDVQRLIADDASALRAEPAVPYYEDMMLPMLVASESDLWHTDMRNFFAGVRMPFRTVFWRHGVEPIAHAHKLFKQGDFEGAYIAIDDCAALDWRDACRSWLDRRLAARLEKERV